MSGGSLKYVSGYIDEACDKIKEHIYGEKVDECDVESYIREYDLDDKDAKYIREHLHTKPNPYEYSKVTLRYLKRAIHSLEKAAIYAHETEWLLSGDYGEETFHKCLVERLKELKHKKDE